MFCKEKWNIWMSSSASCSASKTNVTKPATGSIPAEENAMLHAEQLDMGDSKGQYYQNSEAAIKYLS